MWLAIILQTRSVTGGDFSCNLILETPLHALHVARKNVSSITVSLNLIERAILVCLGARFVYSIPIFKQSIDQVFYGSCFEKFLRCTRLHIEHPNLVLDPFVICCFDMSICLKLSNVTRPMGLSEDFRKTIALWIDQSWTIRIFFPANDHRVFEKAPPHGSFAFYLVRGISVSPLEKKGQKTFITVQTALCLHSSTIAV